MPDISIKHTGEGVERSAIIGINNNLLGHDQHDTVKDLVDKEMTDGISKFVFDMTGLESINSSGLGILISSFKKIKDNGGKLEIRNMNEKILGIFKLTKLDSVFGLQ